MKRVEILGVPIDVVTMKEALSRTMIFLKNTEQYHITTPNNEMILEAQDNKTFLSVLQRSALSIPDSTGVLWAAKRMGSVLPERVTGVDFTEQLCRTLSQDQPVFFLGGMHGAGRKTAEVLQSYNPNLIVAGTYEGSPNAQDAEDILTRIRDSGAVLLFVAFGAPAQELWIDQYLHDLPLVKVAIGIGGTFDFLSGRMKRAPYCVQKLGLEWLWRLIQQPSRLRRIWNATILFPLRVLFS